MLLDSDRTKDREEQKSSSMFILYPKNHGISKLMGLEIPETCYTQSNPSIKKPKDC